MSRILFKDCLALVDHYNINRTYSKSFKCNVVLSLHQDCWYMPGLNYARKEYKVALWDYIKLKDSVYKKVMLGMRIFYRLDDVYLFLEKVVMNGCNFNGIKIYKKKEKKQDE